MAATAYKTIVLKGKGMRKEALANASITPGMLVEEMSTGKIRAHSTAGGRAGSLWAVEDDLQGNGITDAYSANNRAQYEAHPKGNELYALIADGENIAIGDKLCSNGDGYLKEATPDSSGVIVEDTIVAIAKAVCDRSTSSGGDTNTTGRCVVEVY